MEPGQSYALKDRFICDKCGKQPDNFVAATNVDGSIAISVGCHGEEENRTFTKSELVFTQRLFKKKE